MINDYHRDLDRIVENSKKKIVKAVKDKKVLKENADLILTFVEKHRPKGQRLKLHTVNRHLINLCRILILFPFELVSCFMFFKPLF